MARALVVTSSFLPGSGGIETYLADLCSELRPCVAVLAPGRRDGKPLPRNLAYPTIPLPRSFPVPDRRTVAAIRTAAATQEADRVLFGTPWPLALLGPGLKRSGLSYAVIAHGAELVVPSTIPGVGQRLRHCLREADVVFAVSNHTASHARNLIGADGPPVELLRARLKLDRLRPRSDRDEVRARMSLTGRDRVVLCFGRLVRRKGVHRMIEVLPLLSQRLPDVVLVVAGTGPEEARLRSQARRHKARVIFAGHVQDERVAEVYSTADVFVLPSADRWLGLDTEGLGVVLLEAAACGVPSVAGASGGTSEAVVQGRTGFVVDARDKGALTKAVAWTLEHPEQARRMGAAGRAYVESEFSRRELPTSLTEWLR